MPERLEVTLTPKTPALRAGQPAEIDVAARYLYGAPGAEPRRLGRGRRPGRSTTPAHQGARRLRGRPRGRARRGVDRRDRGARHDRRAGRVAMPVPVPGASRRRARSRRKITLRVGEAGGRAVERSVTLPILPEGPGRRAWQELRRRPRRRRDRDLRRGLAPARTARASRARAWPGPSTRSSGATNGSTATGAGATSRSSRRAASPTAASTSRPPSPPASRPRSSGAPTASTCASTASRRAQTSVSFTVGWSGDQTADTPDLLDMTLDKASYGAGDTIQRAARRRASPARRRSRSSATRCTTCASSTSPPSGTTVTIPVKAEWGAGRLSGRARAPAARRKRPSACPAARSGLAWFEIDRAARTLRSSCTAPAQMRPRGALTPADQGRRAAARRGGAYHRRGRRCRHPQPDPLRGAGSRRLLLRPEAALDRAARSLRLPIDGMQGTRGAIRSGGDGAAALEGIPPTQEPLARYSGVVKVGAGRHRRASPSTSRPSTARCGSWRSPGRKDRVGSATRRRDRARSGRRDRHAAALPLGRRPVALLHAARQCRGAGRRLHRSTSTSTGRWCVPARRAAHDRPARRRRPRARSTIPVTAAGPGSPSST